MQRLSDVTECAVCADTFKDPRILPCHHTFCRQCLVECGRDKRPGELMPCPLCRKLFFIPADGLAGTQKDFTMTKLLIVQRNSTEEVRNAEGRDIFGEIRMSFGEAVAIVFKAASHNLLVAVRYVNKMVVGVVEALKECKEHTVTFAKRLGTSVIDALNACKDRAVALVNTDVGDLGMTSVRWLLAGLGNWVLYLIVPAVPAVTGMIRIRDIAVALTSHEDHVFVICANRQHKVEVFDAATFKSLHSLLVEGPDHLLVGIVACDYNQYLYLSDWNHDCVRRIKLSTAKRCTGVWHLDGWPVDSHPAGLTVNCDHNVIVANQGRRLIQIFTSAGVLVRNIALLEDGLKTPVYPEYAVQLPNGNILVSGPSIVLVEVKGSRTRCVQLTDLVGRNRPKGFATDTSGNVMIAAGNGPTRLTVLNEALTSAHAVTGFPQLNHPRSLWYDESRCRLYVTERSDPTVFVIDRLDDFMACTASQTT